MSNVQRMNVVDNVWDTITSFDHLLEAYHNARKSKRFRPEFLAFEAGLDDNIHDIQAQLKSGTFRFGPYQRHWVYVPKKRMVMALPVASRIVQWAIYMVLDPYFDRRMIGDSYACRKGKGSVAAVKRVQYWMRQVNSKPEEYSVIKIDISKYFYRINHDILKDILSRYIKDQQLMALLCQVIDGNGESFGLPRGCKADDIPISEWRNDVGMPIGNLTSQMFANIYLNELDQYCKHVLKIRRYARYMDDIVAIVPRSEAKAVFDSIKAFLADRLALDVNRKSAIMPVQRVEFVGSIITPKRVTLRKQTARRIKRAWRAICRSYFAGEISEASFRRRRDSYNGMIAHVDAANLRRRLNEIYMTERKGKSVEMPTGGTCPCISQAKR